MAQQIQTYSITAPGFYGLNSQDSSLDLASGFALTAINCVIDKYGRVGARKGWSALNTVNVTLGTNSIKSICELVTTAGTSYILVAGDGALFLYSGGALNTLTYGGPGVAPTITDSNWQMVALDDLIFMFQSGHDPLLFEPAASTTTYRRITEHAGAAGTPPSGNVALSAYGRVWVTDTVNNKTTIFWSDLLEGYKWSGGTSGSLNVDQVWPNGGDVIVGLGAHNGFLFIFGKNNILVYSGATAPATMSLSDTVTGIGCIARDSIQNTGTDLIFLSATGVRSVLRTIQEKSAPFRDLSKNVRDELMTGLSGEVLANVKAVYSPIDSFYLITVPSLGLVYCFDTKQQLQDGSSRATTWNGISPKSFFYTSSKELLLGKEGYLGKYGTYQDNGSSYRMSYFTNHTDLGAPSVSSTLKKLSVVVIGGTNQYVTIKWGYDFKENYYSQSVGIPEQSVSYYGIAEYNTTAQYADGVTLQTLVAYPTGAGKVIQTGYEADINGSALSIQKIEIQAKNGKIL